MPPYQGGGSMIDRVTFEKTTYAPPPQRFEAGTPAIAEALGLHAAIDYVDAVGLDRIHALETALAAQLRAQLGAMNDVTVFGPADSAGIVRSEEHTSELQSLMRSSYAVFRLKKTEQHT